MVKRKYYVLMIATHYPKSHSMSGVETGFEDKIMTFIEGTTIPFKRTSIRANWTLWKKRFEKIAAGEAYLSVRKWTGKPYRSKQVEIERFDSSHGIGIEKLMSSSEGPLVSPSDKLKGFKIVPEGLLALNDGLLLDNFREWFKGYPDHEPKAIIHFTDFRYCKS